MLCHSCENQIADSAEFCPFCGTKVRFTQSEQDSQYDNAAETTQTSRSSTESISFQQFYPQGDFNIVKWWNESWNAVIKNLGTLVAIGTIYIIARMILSSTSIGILVVPGILAGFMIVIKEYHRSQRDPDFVKLFTAGWKFFGDMLLFWIVGIILMMIGLCCFIIPSIMVQLAFNIAGFLIVDKNASFSQAFNSAMYLFGRHFGGLLLLSLILVLIGFIIIVLVLIPFLGWALILILLLLLTPFWMIFYFKAYEDLFNSNSST